MVDKNEAILPMNQLIWRSLIVLWVAPNTLIGLLLGGLGLLSGGRVQFADHCIEFFGGALPWLLDRLPCGNVVAMTLGHTILGQSAEGLAFAREHEQVHVRQYERWGPFFIPAYLACSLCLWTRGRDFYRENPFEVEAYRVAGTDQDS